MGINDLDIDWDYLLERLESLMDLGEEYLGRELVDLTPDPETLRRHQAFRWVELATGGTLVEVPHVDTPELTELIGLEAILDPLRRNTRQFVHGYPASNVLLWGEPGSGKSTTVKGLLKEFAPQGLRLVDIRHPEQCQFAEIAAQLRHLPYKFILFCDDLTLSATDRGAQELKALLEGDIEARPDNLLVYATSLFRHLQPDPGDHDGAEVDRSAAPLPAAQRSLAGRFGIRLEFPPLAPTPYLEIVHALASRRGLEVSRDQLDTQALACAEQQKERTGRVARQLVDALTGSLRLKEDAPR